jgi:hypothetical protein
MLLYGCQATRVVVIPADKTVTRLEAAEPFTPSIPGWFVPDARMQEILARLGGLVDEPKTNAVGRASADRVGVN